jgi:hypothetical protein
MTGSSAWTLREVALDGSLHRAPCGGVDTGINPTDRAKLGWKWSIAVDANGIPIGWAIDGANRNELKLLGSTLDDVARVGLLADIETLHLDRGYDYAKTRRQLASFGLDDLNIQHREPKGATERRPLELGLTTSSLRSDSRWRGLQNDSSGTDVRIVCELRAGADTDDVASQIASTRGRHDAPRGATRSSARVPLARPRRPRHRRAALAMLANAAEP